MTPRCHNYPITLPLRLQVYIKIKYLCISIRYNNNNMTENIGKYCRCYIIQIKKPAAITIFKCN